MAIETNVRTSLTIKNIVVALICLGFGLWGWYDYSIAIPRERADFDAFTAAEKTRSDLETAARSGPLTDEQKLQFKEVDATLARFTEKPSEPASYDDDIQLWVYIVGCGVLGTPWFLYAQWKLMRRRYRLDDDGTLHAPEGTFSSSELAEIDMSNWMEKSIATVVTTDGKRIDLDDYQYRGIEDIVAVLAARFHPGQWTSDARPIGDPKSRDTKKALAEAEAAAAASDNDDSQRS
ncbi:MAG: hypothetical protein RLY21_1605 [Planctomycetota bacterium]|jgi:hypothetical protein